MSAFDRARTAYSPASMPNRNDKAVEYDALARITRRLRATDTDESGFPELAEALDQNRKLWFRFAADVAEPTNPLPQELKAQIYYLYEFTNQHTSKVLSRKSDASVLVEINTAIMRGLRGKGEAA
ncbi:flagellar biosynthesis regulator FlaF [Qingshengfaniella alkalisoli]|uniref:Flagellar biosynthesis regulator FlaF n=1 Tax=Qingshengfaniella alkalisoli TaxID=2599296 RepID=A0A5B8IVM2_9RHOB|nr:flagellar biosynthesis regulator FlaF [Qingshengfaniella alkalisoli]QDY70162.1 flagellar biosynthesis regulator FlaF [Qingshengfaniella alkalisoli]